MNSDLEARYRVLLFAYDTGQSDLLADVKLRLLKENAILRPDAALCLLTLYDQMIVRAYTGYIPIPENPSGIPTPPIGSNRSAFMDNVRQSLDKLLDHVKGHKSETLASSHEVLQAINARWADLSIMFGWA